MEVLISNEKTHMPYKNIEDKRQNSKKYYNENRENILLQKKAISKKDKYIYNKEYRDKNKEEINKRQRERHANRCKLDIWYKLAHSLRARLYKICNLKWCSKQNKTLEYVWCTKEFLVKYIESQFLEWMSWENRSDWHIDHIIPISLFNLEIESEIYKAMNFTNLQPLWATDNIKKSNKIR